MKINNKGLSLVELLVAISITAVIAGSVAYFLTTSLRMYGNESANIALQQELQTTVNQIVDYAMESQALVVEGTATDTEYVMLGTIKSKSDPDKLDAQVIWIDNDSLYLRKAEIDDYKNTDPGETLRDKAAALVIPASASKADKEKYLLAEYVGAFNVTVDGIDTVTGEYRNPLTVNISIEFSKKGANKDINKNVYEKAVLRNRVNTTVYVNGAAYTKAADSVDAGEIIETETVSMEKAAANGKQDVYYVYPEEGSAKTSFNVLEIIPDKNRAVMSYFAGGKEPIDKYALDAAANREIGRLNGLQIGDGPGSIKENNHLFNAHGPSISTEDSIPAYIVGEVNKTGYFEKVDGSFRDGRGGVYAINRDRRDNGKYRLDTITFYSEYASSNFISSYNKSDFCWIWVDDDTNTRDCFDIGGNLYTEIDVNTLENSVPGTKIYLSGGKCKKYETINNELFILMCLSNDTSNGTCGLIENEYTLARHYGNMQKIDTFNKDKLNFYALSPQELSTSDGQAILNKADLIVFEDKYDDRYKEAERVRSVEYGTTSGPQNYTSDITFAQMKQIFFKVLNMEAAIAVEHETYDRCRSNNYYNMYNLFYMLFEFENQNIVTVDGQMYGNETNKYHIGDAAKVSANRNTYNAYKWSGRYMFSDFFTDSYDANTKNAYDYDTFAAGNVLPDGKTKASDYIYFDEATGRIVVKNRSGGTVKTVNRWDNGIIGDRNNFCQVGDVSFLLNDIYKNRLGFYRRENNDTGKLGAFANQAKFNDVYNIIRFSKNNNPTGSLSWVAGMIRDIKSSGPAAEERDPVIGTIILKGAGVGCDSADKYEQESQARFNLPANTANIYYEDSGVTYAHRFEETTDDTNDKILYINGYEFEKAKEADNGLFVYFVVESTEDVTNLKDPPHMWTVPTLMYTRNLGDGHTQNNPCDIDSNDPPVVVRYKGKTDAADKADSVIEYRCHIMAQYFQNFTPPYNNGNNKIVVTVEDQQRDANSKTPYLTGSDSFRIIVRDYPDLD